jgi:hypothetical protein
MQAFFPRIDLAAHRQQVARVATQLKENPPAAAPPKLAVGRRSTGFSSRCQRIAVRC